VSDPVARACNGPAPVRRVAHAMARLSVSNVVASTAQAVARRRCGRVDVAADLVCDHGAILQSLRQTIGAHRGCKWESCTSPIGRAEPLCWRGAIATAITPSIVDPGSAPCKALRFAPPTRSAWPLGLDGASARLGHFGYVMAGSTANATRRILR
jgi:hypothetical protein